MPSVPDDIALNFVKNYIDHACAYCLDIGVAHPITGVFEPPNEELMASAEAFLILDGTVAPDIYAFRYKVVTEFIDGREYDFLNLLIDASIRLLDSQTHNHYSFRAKLQQIHNWQTEGF